MKIDQVINQSEQKEIKLCESFSLQPRKRNRNQFMCTLSMESELILVVPDENYGKSQHID